jgi:hypothetical protein
LKKGNKFIKLYILYGFVGEKSVDRDLGKGGG